MKILHITPAYEPAWHLGGVVRSVSQFCRGLAKLDLDVTVFTTDSGGDRRMLVPTEQEIEIGGVKVNYYKTDLTPKFGYSRNLSKACKRRMRDYDIVHITSLWWYTEIIGWKTATASNVPYIVSPTGGLSKYSLSQKWLKKFLYLNIIGKRILNSAQAIHYNTEIEKENAAHLKLRVPNFIIPGGIDTDEFKELPSKAQARQEMGFPADKSIILFLGRLHVVKNLDMLIKAFFSIQDNLPNSLLIIAGPDDGQERYLRKLSAELDISDKVLFPGEISPRQRNNLLRSADLCALISYHENLGNFAIEAMLAGRPVIVSEYVGVCRDVRADKAGQVVPHDPGKIGKSLSQLLANPEQLERMGESAAISARNRYALDTVVKKMAMAYEDIITGKRSQGLHWSNT